MGFEIFDQKTLNFFDKISDLLVSVIENFFVSYGTKFWDVICGWYYDILGWKYIMIFNWEQKTCSGPIRSLFT